MKRFIKKIIRVILILMVSMSLLTACTYKVYASSAVGVVVAGGSIGTGGAAVGLLGMLGPVTAILGVALASYGIYVTLDSAAEEEGLTKTDFIYSKLSEYNEQRNLSNSAMQDLILEGASILKNGAISISHSASAYINGFINYLSGGDQIIPPDSITEIPSSVTFGGVELPVIVPYQEFPVSNSYPRFFIQDTNNTYRLYVACHFGGSEVYFISNSGGTIYWYQNSNRANNMRLYREGLYYHVISAGYHYLPADKQFIPDLSPQFSNINEFLAQSTGDLSFAGGVADSSFIGDMSVYNDRAGTLAPADGENTVFTPPLVGGITGTGSISVPDYLDAINQLLNTGTADITISDPITGVESIATVTDIDLTDSVPTVETEEEQDTVGTTAVVNPDAPLDPDVDLVNGLAFDLTEIFPFCIPFDMYDLLSKFVADPVAPYWEISIPLPLDLPAIEFEIDFSEFETVAAILRSFEMVLFVGSLAIATRSIYLRG